MNLKLISMNLVSGPERARGGDALTVGVDVSFGYEGTIYRSVGFGIIKIEDDNGLKTALVEAVAQAASIVEATYNGVEIKGPAVPVEALKAVAKIASSAAIANAKLKGNKQTAEELEQPSDDTQQKQLDQVCNELGIQPINVIGLEKGMSLALFKALEGLLTEAKPNPDGD